MKNQAKKIIWIAASLIMAVAIHSCDDFEKFEPLGENSIADETPPMASFGYTQGEGLENDEWKGYTFANYSSGATTYLWDFGDGTTSTAVIGEDIDASHTYSGEGTWTVSLTASDKLGATSVFEEIIEVVEPEAPDVLDPVLVNTDFDKIPKSSGSDCSCSGWINKSLGDQGESSNYNSGAFEVLKFDNNEPDAIYQEFEVQPNADYLITIYTSFKEPSSGATPTSMLELRVLAGSGYVDGYSPTYYAEAVEFPQDDWGYESISQAEDTANNLITEVLENPFPAPDSDSYFTTLYTFNAGANTSVALFMRGIGGPATGGGGSDLGYNSGAEEIRIDYITILANN